MDTPLRRRMESLAMRFVDEVMGAISDSLAEHFAGRGGREAGPVVFGRSLGAGDVADRVVRVLGEHGDGVRAEDLRAAVGVPRSAMVRPLARLLEEGRIRKTGEKRRTTYFLVGDAASDGAAAKPARRRRGGGRKSKTRAA